MQSSFGFDNFGDLLAFPFREDGGWKKLFLGALVLALAFPFILPGILVDGYYVRLIRQVLQGEPPHMPEWDDWGKLLTDGFKLLGSVFVYMLPIFVVLFGSYLIFILIFVFRLHKGFQMRFR